MSAVGSILHVTLKVTKCYINLASISPYQKHATNNVMIHFV